LADNSGGVFGGISFLLLFDL